MKYEIKNANACYTGGGIYIFTGELTDGNYFLATNDEYDVRILNADPDEYDGEYGDLNMDNVDWQIEHLVEDLSENKYIFMKNVIEWILNMEPMDGNYSLYDMQGMLNTVNDYIKEINGILKVFRVTNCVDYYYVVCYAANENDAVNKAIAEWNRTEGIHTCSYDWTVEEFTPDSYGGVISFS